MYLAATVVSSDTKYTYYTHKEIWETQLSPQELSQWVFSYATELHISRKNCGPQKFSHTHFVDVHIPKDYNTLFCVSNFFIQNSCNHVSTSFRARLGSSHPGPWNNNASNYQTVLRYVYLWFENDYVMQQHTKNLGNVLITFGRRCQFSLGLFVINFVKEKSAPGDPVQANQIYDLIWAGNFFYSRGYFWKMCCWEAGNLLVAI